MLVSEDRFLGLIRDLTPELARTEKEASESYWHLATNSTKEHQAGYEKANLAYKILRSDKRVFQKLKEFKNGLRTLWSPRSQRMLEILYDTYLPNQISPRLLSAITEKEAKLEQIFAEFRANPDGPSGGSLSENDIKDILCRERNVGDRKKIWEASKQIGLAAAPTIIEVVKLRNQSARELGYQNYYEMSLALQELDSRWLTETFKDLAEKSNTLYSKTLAEIDERLAKRFGVDISEVGPWAWNDTFCQEDPLELAEFDELFAGKDVVALAGDYYQSIGFGSEFQDILSRSDLYERPNKNQHGFCMDADRNGDIRILMNVRQNGYWFSVTLHEFGHGVDSKGIMSDLPWILRIPSHTLTTEAIAIFFGNQLYRLPYLRRLFGTDATKEKIFAETQKSVLRQKMIFSRWVMTMTEFESKLYTNPEQDLNELWWSTVGKIQGIAPPPRPKSAADWAAKIHVALSPVYYHNYLLGELASEQLLTYVRTTLHSGTESHGLAELLKDRWFSFGSALRWSEVIHAATDRLFSIEPWLNSLR